jgi:hypothetical protein
MLKIDSLFNWFQNLFSKSSMDSEGVHLENIKRSKVSVNIIKEQIVTGRAEIILSDAWFERMLEITYDEDVKSKYIPELHQITDFERTKLNYILDFTYWKEIHSNQISICKESLEEFKKSCNDFYQILDGEPINLYLAKHNSLNQIRELYQSIGKLDSQLNHMKIYFESDGYSSLLKKTQISEIQFPKNNSISFSSLMVKDLAYNNAEDYNFIRHIIQHYNEVNYNLNELNFMLSNFKTKPNHIIIAGIAGTGKTHISAHLINSFKSNGDYVIFFKSKQFNGDNVNLYEKLLQLLQIPNGYNVSEILDQVNNFAISKNRRCFIIIDALNETTKSSIGFSNIWSNHLQEFINLIGLYSHCYFICTLRTSYIENIWRIKPGAILEIKGFQKDIKEACTKYFNYYKINAINIETADLNYFRVPLLLDLFCKLTNESRKEEKSIYLNVNTYLQIFEDYIASLTIEIKNRLNLQKAKRIIDGLTESSKKFLANNEAIISLDEFSDAFDKNDDVSRDNSIARLILEGYLIFIKDNIGRNNEIVKHTQQEVGGYLLARMLSDLYSSSEELLSSSEFRQKIVGVDPAEHHQLRLDVLKFLIAINPELIYSLKDEDSKDLSWWYLYNGFESNHDKDISNYLLYELSSKSNIEYILNASSSQWLNPANDLNFHFISKVLEKLEMWEFDVNWTFYIYKEADSFYELIDLNIKIIMNSNEENLEYHELVAKVIAYVTATNIRELRDRATMYLIEFGKRYPLSLLELTEYSTCIIDSYIYERLSSCCYGVALILQNDTDFIENNLPVIANRLFKLQFSQPSKIPVYNYIVIDSIKHIVDLAVHKGVISKSKLGANNIDNYQFHVPSQWIPPTKKQRNLINQSNRMSLPKPIGMDFGIYTIPRLIKDDNDEREAIANVYKRIFEIGYKDIESLEDTDERFKNFYYGHKIPGYEGKVDRLGKKYSWKGFFDFAGFLLQKGHLNVYEQKESGKKSYKRLDDVDIDISLPLFDYKLPIRVYPGNLLENKNKDPEWYREIKIDSITPYFERLFTEDQYIMLYGSIDQRVDEEYAIRSFLLAETFFIRKNENFGLLQQNVLNQVFAWAMDIHASYDQLRKAYFGELYWADNIPESSFDSISIPTGKNVNITRKLEVQDILGDRAYKYEDIGKEVEETRPEKLHFESIPTLVNYSWESESINLEGYSEYYPSINMGKYLRLKADPRKRKILDSNLNDSFHCIKYEDQFFQNAFNYMRSDLLRKYMEDNNLALLYQIKQHSYDVNFDHNRSMKFFILE